MKEKIAEMKHVLLQLINSYQFFGIDHEDPHTYLYTFYELSGTVGIIGTDKEALFSRLFPFSLIINAMAWL